MNRLRRVWSLLHLAGLLAGAGLCIWGMVVTLTLVDEEAFHLSLERGVCSIALLAITAAYFWLFVRSRSTTLALPLYLFSFVLCGGTLKVSINGLAKGFPPLLPNEAFVAYTTAVAAILIVVGCVTAAVIWMSRAPARRA